MDISKIKRLAKEVALKLGITVYRCEMIDGESGKELEIEVDKPTFITLDEITEFSNELSQLLDEIEELDFPYSLNCFSADPEREIALTDLNLYSGAYVLVETELESAEGELIVEEDDFVTIKTFIKGRPKKYHIAICDIKKINLRVKI